MAVYNGREVTVVTSIPKGFQNPTLVTVRYKDGSVENINVNDLYFSVDEKKELQKNTQDHMNGIKTISDEDLKNLRDSQDEKKIKERLEKQNTPQVAIVNPKPSPSK